MQGYICNNRFLHLQMKHNILAIATVFSFGIATYIMIGKIGSPNARANNEIVNDVEHPTVNKSLNADSSKQKTFGD
jgi:hypothetical protein